MLGFGFGLSSRAIADPRIIVLTVRDSECLDIRAEPLFDLRIRSAVLFALEIDHEPLFDLRIRADKEC